jgi:CheY-like chemotaxis protein
LSYPLLVQILVIEDYPETKAAYETMLEELAVEFPLAPACYAFSYDDALEHLDREKIFHIVILDLELPRVSRTPTTNGIDLGQALLRVCADRDNYPVPSLLVISGHIDKVDQAVLKLDTESGFAHGTVLVKGDYAMLQNEIRRAIVETRRYCEIGVHLRDSEDRRFPTVSPRNEDLLRRVILRQTGAIGTDVGWWSATRFGTKQAEWTKVLVGRFLFDRGDRPSRPNFFKFMPALRGQLVIEAAQRMVHKLGHIKLNGVESSATSALIVTEKVGISEETPVSLAQYLASSDTTPEAISRCAAEVSDQVDALGDHGPQLRPVRDLLWKCHDEKLITQAVEEFRELVLDRFKEPLEDIATLFEHLSSSAEMVQFDEQTFLHGDLHIDNIALDVTPKGADAYIFDAGGTESSSRGRDIAALEVSLLLHQELRDEDFVRICEALYTRDTSGDVALEPRFDTEVARNTYIFICALRRSISNRCERRTFALMVFDFALVQLVGLTFSAFANKISDPRHAITLTAASAGWYRILDRPGPTDATQAG